MNVIGSPGIAKADFELVSLAVSAVNGCGKCVTAHERVLRQHEVGREAVQSAVRIASVIHAVRRRPRLRGFPRRLNQLEGEFAWASRRPRASAR